MKSVNKPKSSCRAQFNAWLHDSNFNQMARRCDRSNGFTLVELLIVIAIVMLIVAAIIPVTSRLRDRADSASALSNLASFGNLWALVATDNNQRLPSGYVGGKDWGIRLTSTEFRKDIDLGAFKVAYANPIAKRKEGYRPSSGERGFLDTGTHGFNQNVSFSRFADTSSGTWSPVSMSNPGKFVVLGDLPINPSWGSCASIFHNPSELKFRYAGQTAHILFADWHVTAVTKSEAIANSGWFKLDDQ